MSSNQSQPLQQLKTQMQSAFDLDEIRELCMDLEITYDEIAGDTLSSKIIALITYLGREEQLPNLIHYLIQKRPNYQWPQLVWEQLNQRAIENFNSQTLSTEERIDHDVVLEKLMQNYANIQSRMFDTDGKLQQIPFTNFEDVPDAIEIEADNIPGFSKRTKRTFASGTTIRDIFTTSGFGLLILGEPGYGKTAAIYDLADQLLTQTKQDLWAPLPVIVNLSTWNPHQYLNLESWLQSRLQKRYAIPPETSKTWLAKGNMILFLDALDEIQPQHAQECLSAIVQFQQTKLHARIVVTSRTTEYDDLGIKLNLPAAVRLLPLTETQIVDYFDQLGIDSDTSDEEVGELLTESLMLNIFSQITLAKTRITRHVGQQITRTTLLNDYIHMLFERRRMQPINEEETCTRLSYIAQQMEATEVYDLDLEQLQPTWLTDRKHRRTYNLYVILFVFLIFMAIFGFMFFLLGLISPVNVQRILSGMENDGYADLSPFIVTIAIISIKLGMGILLTMVAGFPVAMGAAFVTAILLKRQPEIKPVRRFRWPKIRHLMHMDALLIIARTSLLFILLGIFVISTIFVLLSAYLSSSRSNVFSAYFVFVIGFGIAGAIFGSFQTTFEYDETTKGKNRSNPRIWRSGQTGLTTGVAAFFLLTLIFGLFFSRFFIDFETGKIKNFIGVLYIIMIVAITLGVSIGLYYGGHVFIRHYILRWVLARYDYLPRHLELFLNEMADFTFLQRIGVGYRFFHATAQTHFAQLNQWPPLDQEEDIE